MLNRLWSGGGSGGGNGGEAGEAPAPALRPAEALQELQRQVEKLRGFYEVAKSAIEHAVTKHEAGQTGEAAKLYQIALDAALEGLALPVPTAGLPSSSVTRWRSELHSWQQMIPDLLHKLGGPGGGGAAAAAAAVAAAAGRGRGGGSVQPPPRPVMRPQPAAAARAAPAGRAAAGRAAGPTGGGSGGSREEREFDERVLSEVLDRAPSVAWDDVAGLAAAKQALGEMVILPTVRADLFQGLRAPARGLLLYGPPGNGKTMLAKALAHEAQATFFNISAASLTSRWHGDAEKLVRALFRVAARHQPAIIFIDEIDSILSERSSSEHEASRRLKTEFLVQFDGVAGSSDRVVVIGATNRPWELDDAVRRRLPKRVCIPLPDAAARRAMVARLLQGQRLRLGDRDVERIVAMTDGYSGSDLAALCKEAAMLPIRRLGPQIATVAADAVPPIEFAHFREALQAIKPSVSREQLRRFDEWTREYGMSA